MLKGKFVVTTDAILKGLAASEEQTKEHKKSQKLKKKEVMIDETEDDEDESEGEQRVIGDCITVER